MINTCSHSITCLCATGNVDLESFDALCDHLGIPLDLSKVKLLDANEHVLARAEKYRAMEVSMKKAASFILNSFDSKRELMKTFVEFVETDDLRSMSSKRNGGVNVIGITYYDKKRHAEWFVHPVFQNRLNRVLSETHGMSCNWMRTRFEIKKIHSPSALTHSVWAMRWQLSVCFWCVLLTNSTISSS